VVSYGEKTEMCASYQNATYIYLQRMRFYYRALIDHKDKLIVSGVSGRPCPHRRDNAPYSLAIKHRGQRLGPS
jgi:hypothetical protein